MLQAISSVKAMSPRFAGVIHRSVGLEEGAPITLSAYQEPIEGLLGSGEKGHKKGGKAFAEFEAEPDMTARFAIRRHWIPESRPQTFLRPEGGEIPAAQVQPFSLDVTVEDDLKQTQHPRLPAWCASVKIDDQKQTRTTARLGIGAYQDQLYLLGDESEVHTTATRAGSQDHPPRFRLITPLRPDHLASALNLLVSRLRHLRFAERVTTVRSSFPVHAFSSSC